MTDAANWLYGVATWMIPLAIAIVFHEVAHGRVARWFGDRTAAEQGRLSFNPVRHVDPIGTVILPLLLALSNAPIFGWAKPVPVDAARMRNPRWNMVAVALAGPAMNVGLAFLAALVLGVVSSRLPDGSEMAGFLNQNLLNFIAVNLFLAVFNMIPLPPFDGSKVLGGLLPPALGRQFAELDRYALFFIFGLLFVLPLVAPQADVVGRLVRPPVQWLFSLIADFVRFLGM